MLKPCDQGPHECADHESNAIGQGTAGKRPSGHFAPKAVAFKSPRKNWSPARTRARTHHLSLSDKDVSEHLQRLSEPSPELPSCCEATMAGEGEPFPQRSASHSPSGSSNTRPDSRLSGLLSRPLSQQSCLSSTAWSSASGRSIGGVRSAVETPPSAPGAFEAGKVLRLCRAPVARQRGTRLCTTRSSRLSSGLGSSIDTERGAWPDGLDAAQRFVPIELARSASAEPVLHKSVSAASLTSLACHESHDALDSPTAAWPTWG